MRRKRTYKTVFLSLVFVVIFSLSCSAETRIFFSPRGGIAEEIVSQIDIAEDYIDIAMYSFTSELIAEAVIRAKCRGVKIRILMDSSQAGGKYSKYGFFLDKGITIIRDRHAGIMHNKIAIIDGRVLFTGSYNWTESAEERNEENILMFIDEEEIIELYQERLDYLWEFNK